MGANTAEANNDNEGRAEFGEAGIGKEDAVTGELLKDQLVIVFASSGSGGDLCASGVFFACQRGWGCGAVFCELSIAGSVELRCGNGGD